MFKILVEEWTDGLKNVGDADLEYGLEQLNKEAGTFSPSLPKFLDCCKPPKRLHPSHRALSEREHQLDASRYGALPAPKVGSPDRPSLYVQKFMKTIQEKLRIKHLDDDLKEKKHRAMEGLNNVNKGNS